MGSKPAWSVIVPTRNRSASLGNTLAYLARQELHSLLYEIIVVDNASTDETHNVVEHCREEYPSRVIKYVHTPQPGLLFGRHAGAKAASAALLTFIDDDVEVRPDYGQAIITAFADPSVSFVGGPSLPKFLGPLPHWLTMFMERDAEGSFCTALSLMDKGNRARDVLPRWVWGLNFSLRRDVLWQLGGFHPDGVPDELLLFRGDGEFGLALAAEQAGLKARYVPGAGVTHVIPAERLTPSYIAKRFFAEGISASYTAIRKAGGMENLPSEPQPADNSDQDVTAHTRNAFALGYQWHRNAVRSSRALLDWVCRPDYFDAEYPELPANLPSRPVLHIPQSGRASNYGESGQQEGRKDENAFEKALTKRIIEAIQSPPETMNSVSFYAYSDESARIEDEEFAATKRKRGDSWNTYTNKIPELTRQIITKEQLYNLLADNQSKTLLTDVAAYCVLGHNFVRLPYHRQSNRTLRQALSSVTTVSEPEGEQDIVTKLHNVCRDATGNYGLFDLRRVGIPLQLYTCDEDIFRYFFSPSYTYMSYEQCISVEQDDIVLDCGACLCDTALFFAISVGHKGRIISFEPMPDNVFIAERNLSLNPQIAKRITIIKAATGDKEGALEFTDWGPASHFGAAEHSSASLTVPVTTLDIVVRQLNLPKVDFIKMDIEGFELNALHGAENTIRKFRPKLAICLYHKPEDFANIPIWIQSLNLGYKFYLGHHYINEFETVLYAKSEH